MTVRPCAALRDGGCAPSGRKWRMHRTDRRLALQPAGGRLREMRRGRRRRRRGKGRDRGQAEQGAGVTAGCQHRLQPCFCATSLMRCSHQLARDLPRLALPCPSLRCCVLHCCARCCFDFPVACWCIILLVIQVAGAQQNHRTTPVPRKANECKQDGKGEEETRLARNCGRVTTKQ